MQRIISICVFVFYCVVACGMVCTARAQDDVLRTIKEHTRLLKDKDPAQRRQGIALLGAMSHPAAVSSVEKMLSDRDPYVRSDAIDTLQQMGAMQAIPAIGKALLRDDSQVVRHMAAMSLGKMKDAAAIPFLLESFGSEQTDVWFRVVTALMKLKTPEAVEPFIAYLSDPRYSNGRQRRHIVQALGRLKDIRAVPVVERELRSDDPEMREIACTVLDTYNLNSASSRGALRPLLTDDRLRVRLAAAESLATLHDTTGLPVAVALLDSADPMIKNRAIKLLGLVGTRAHLGTLRAYARDAAYRTSAELAIQRIEGRLPQ